MAHQCLQHGQVHARLGQCGAEGMPQGVRVPGRHPGLPAVVTEDGAQPGWRQRLAPVRALRHDEQRPAGGIRPPGEQIGLDQPGDAGSSGTRRSLSPLPITLIQPRGCPRRRRPGRVPRPSAAPRTASARRSPCPGQCGSSPATPRSRRGPGHGAAAAARGPAAQNGVSAGPGEQQPASLPGCCPPGPGPARDRARRSRIPHRPAAEQARHRGQPPLDRRRGIARVAAIPDRVHIAARPGSGARPQYASNAAPHWSGAAGPTGTGHQDARAPARRSVGSCSRWPATTRPGDTGGSAAS
jgi:hypothetical protein